MIRSRRSIRIHRPRRALLSVLAASLIASLTLACASAPTEAPGPQPPAQVSPQPEPQPEAIQARVDAGVPGIAGVFIEGNAFRYLAAGVVARPDIDVIPDDPARPDDADVAGTTDVDSLTVFEIGSVAKALTGLLLAEMVVRGEVRLDDAVAEYMPSHVRMPAGARAITLEDLATHRSGLPRVPSNMQLTDMSNPYAAYDVEMLYAFLNGHTLQHEPGEAYAYSNLGAGLLGHVLSLAAGVPYEELVVQRILEPLGMRDTRIVATSSMQERMATGHNALGLAVSRWEFDVLAAAGGWLSTAADMRRLLAAMMNPPAGALGEAIALASQPRADTDPGSRMGLGWHVFGAGDETVVWHNGRTGGYYAFIGHSPARGRGVVMLSNGSMPLDDLAIRLVREGQ